MNLPEIDSNVTVILSILAAAISGGLGLRKAQSMWAKDGSNIAQSGASVASAESQQAAQEAQQSIIRMMREEMQRMSDSNKFLAEQITEFQQKNIQLSADVSMLTSQISSFRAQNIELQREITELRTSLQEYKEKYHILITDYLRSQPDPKDIR